MEAPEGHMQTDAVRPNDKVPEWVPIAARRYLDHTQNGTSIRALARAAGCHPSTVLRQVRRIEAARDDPLIDDMLRKLGGATGPGATRDAAPKDRARTAARSAAPMPEEDEIASQGRRILRRMNEPGSCLAVAQDLPKAVVVREAPDGSTVRVAVVDREIAEAMALRDWIACPLPGRVSRYRITQAGRSALKRFLAADEQGRRGEIDVQAGFADQHRDFDRAGAPGAQRIKPRYNMSESPLVALSRRRNPDGTPFLGEDLVAAGEQLREDFELSQIGPRVAQNWEKFLTGGDRGGLNDPKVGGNDNARQRLRRALDDLGPGLSDVAVRACCFLEGMESVESRMGWAARSGKVVLRIALQRLKLHYDQTENGWRPMIG